MCIFFSFFGVATGHLRRPTYRTTKPTCLMTPKEAPFFDVRQDVRNRNTPPSNLGGYPNVERKLKMEK